MCPYLGTVVDGRRGVENGSAGGADSDFSGRGVEALFALGEGKIAKRALKMHFSTEFWKLVQNMCNFVFLGTVFNICTCSLGNMFSLQRGVNKKVLGTRGVNKESGRRGYSDLTL